MNKRQRKKWKKEISRRCAIVKKHIIWSGRGNGRTQFVTNIIKVVLSEKYRPFKQFEKAYREVCVGVDLSSGKDCTAICRCRVKNGIQQILKIEYE